MDLAMVAAAPRAPAVVETGKQYVEAGNQDNHIHVFVGPNVICLER